MHRTFRNLTLAAFVLALMTPALLVAADGDRAIDQSLFKLTAPEKWVKKEPKSKIVEFEYAAPATKGDNEDGRMTVMRAGGGVDANIERWVGQFTQPDGKSTADRTKRSKKNVAGLEVHVVDISGTYKDQPGGPFGPSVNKEKYRMLAAIIVAKDAQVFVKFYGPEQTIADNEKAFTSMIDGIDTSK
jgi:hypothetical protein